MERIKELGLIISSISAILTVIVLAIKYISNIPYKSIEKSLGVKKNDKSESIVLLILICTIFIIFLIVADIVFSSIGKTSILILICLLVLCWRLFRKNKGLLCTIRIFFRKNKRLISTIFIIFVIVGSIVFWEIDEHRNTVSDINKTSILVLMHLLGSAVLWWILFRKNKGFNQNILKFADINDKIMSEKYLRYSILHLIFIIIIDTFVWVGYLKMPGVNQVDTICLTISIVISVILAIIISSRFELKSSLMSLQNKTIYVAHSEVPLRQCKVIWTNKEYICIYKHSKITYINNKDILKIESLNL